MSRASHVDLATRAYLERAAAAGGKALFEMAVEEARAFMQAGQSVRYGHPSLTVEELAIDSVRCRVIRPRDGEERPPAVLYLHGGGWVLGSPETHAGIVQELALRTGAAFIVPDYALAPEHPFPAALEQCVAVAAAICNGAGPAGIDASRVAIAGDSAGGNLAAAVALHEAGKGAARFRLQALICPALGPDQGTHSYAEFAEGFDLTAEAMRWFWAKYIPDSGTVADPRVSPLRAVSAELARVAPAFVLTAGCDVLRDEAELYARMLWDAGTEATVLRVAGTIHNFSVIDELRASPAGQAAVAAVADALDRAFDSKPEAGGHSPQRTHQG